LDFTKKWTIFALEAEIENVGVYRLCNSHNALQDSLTSNTEKLNKAVELLKRALIYVRFDANMMADLTRFAVLSPEDQAKHDSTEYDCERLVKEIPEFLESLK
jgi:hypothetical protein